MGNRGVKYLRGLGVMMAVFVLALAMVACGGDDDGDDGAGATAAETAPAGSTAGGDYEGFESEYPSEYAEPEVKDGEEFTVGFLNPTAANEQLSILQEAVEKRTAALGGKVIALDDQLSVDKQVSDFNQLLVQGVDAVVVLPLDPRALTPPLKKAEAAGVPVIGIDLTFGPDAETPPGYATQIQQGRDQQAFAVASRMAEALPGGEVGLIGIGIPVPSIIYYVERLQFWGEDMGLTIVGQQDNPTDDIAGGTKAASALLGRYPDMEGIMAYNDPSALGAVAAARSQGRDLVVTGTNGADEGLDGVKAGRLLATIQSDPVGWGVQSVNAAYNLLTDQNLPLPKIIIRPSVLGDESNIDEIQPWSEEVAARP